VKNVVFCQEVREDLLAATAWYDSRRSGLGLEFEEEFFAAIKRVRERPLTFAEDEAGYRPCRLRRFTAVLYFRVAPECIVVLGVLVGGRDTKALLGRG
jgi:hypothetical protein